MGVMLCLDFSSQEWAIKRTTNFYIFNVFVGFMAECTTNRLDTSVSGFLCFVYSNHFLNFLVMIAIRILLILVLIILTFLRILKLSIRVKLNLIPPLFSFHLFPQRPIIFKPDKQILFRLYKLKHNQLKILFICNWKDNFRRLIWVKIVKRDLKILTISGALWVSEFSQNIPFEWFDWGEEANLTNRSCVFQWKGYCLLAKCWMVMDLLLALILFEF